MSENPLMEALRESVARAKADHADLLCVACRSREARFGELCPECKAELDGDTSDVGSP